MYPPEEIQLRPNAVDTPATRQDISGYYAHITALDDNLGRLMVALDELGIADDTILVYTSDHGDMLGSHGHVRKERPWEESARIPFMVRWPRRIPTGGYPGHFVKPCRFHAINVVPMRPTDTRRRGGY